MDSEQDEKRNLSKLSKKLVDGWTLLKDDCPNQNCKVSLISKDAKLFCVSCENYFRRDANGMIWYSRPDDPPSSLPPNTLRELAKALPLPPSSPDVKLPLSNLTQSASIPAPSVGRRLEFSPSTTPTKEFQQRQLAVPSGARVRDGTKVAQKLLEGWTLLNRSCPRCAGTLVADKASKAFCVSCNVHVESAAPSKSIFQNGTGAHMNGSHKDLLEDTEKSNPQVILDNTIRSLYAKMESAREILDQTTNLAECSKLVTLIAECGNSIKILQSVSHT